MPIQCPVLEEQELIASFFGRLDSLITLHQRKYCGVASWMLGGCARKIELGKVMVRSGR